MNELKQNALLNSASHSPWVVRQVALTQQNALLRVALTQQNAFYESVLGSIN
ncbi:hypothetical protein [Leptospira noguchii]|uniref:hypothetical protein n=1 Tax=Leptospira noguchii TaxID=28182 RepID=UPI001FB62C93|nr:hypothetical protein [Leptospira noguchii]UOG44936.1 hypothetical protein MAL01_16695 [Leptospira noguchii]UOG52502.1 hypothetical protein MAL09_18365 [Leptospira noguchii]